MYIISLIIIQNISETELNEDGSIARRRMFIFDKIHNFVPKHLYEAAVQPFRDVYTKFIRQGSYPEAYGVVKNALIKGQSTIAKLIADHVGYTEGTDAEFDDYDFEKWKDKAEHVGAIGKEWIKTKFRAITWVIDHKWDDISEALIEKVKELTQGIPAAFFQGTAIDWVKNHAHEALQKAVQAAKDSY